MDTDDNPKAEAKKSTAASSMLKMVFGSVGSSKGIKKAYQFR